MWACSSVGSMDITIGSRAAKCTASVGARCGAEAHSHQHVTLGRLAMLSVDAAGTDCRVVPAAAPRDRRIGVLHGPRPLPDIARHIVGAYRAARYRMRADLVGAKRERVAAI